MSNVNVSSSPMSILNTLDKVRNDLSARMVCVEKADERFLDGTHNRAIAIADEGHALALSEDTATTVGAIGTAAAGVGILGVIASVYSMSPDASGISFQVASSGVQTVANATAAGCSFYQAGLAVEKGAHEQHLMNAQVSSEADSRSIEGLGEQLATASDANSKVCQAQSKVSSANYQAMTQYHGTR